jgi:hypothetical protein
MPYDPNLSEKFEHEMQHGCRPVECNGITWLNVPNHVTEEELSQKMQEMGISSQLLGDLLGQILGDSHGHESK